MPSAEPRAPSQLSRVLVSDASPRPSRCLGAVVSQVGRTSLKWYIPMGDTDGSGSFSDFMIILLLIRCLDIVRCTKG